MENRKAVPGYEGRYEITDDGDVFALERFATTVKGLQRWPAKKLSTFIDSSNGYIYVNLCDGKKARKLAVHRLVLIAFIGKPDIHQQACHNNGIRTDCRLQNLRWDTVKNNAQDRITHGTQLKGEASGVAKLTLFQVNAIRESAQNSKVLGRMYGVASSTVRAVRIGQNWGGVAG